MTRSPQIPNLSLDLSFSQTVYIQSIKGFVSKGTAVPRHCESKTRSDKRADGRNISHQKYFYKIFKKKILQLRNKKKHSKLAQNFLDAAILNNYKLHYYDTQS